MRVTCALGCLIVGLGVFGLGRTDVLADGAVAPAQTNAPHASLAAYPNAVISVTDGPTGITVSVEPNGRELKAMSKDGTVLWKADLIKQWGKPKVGSPVIRYLALGNGKVSVTIGKHMNGDVDLKTGKPRFAGED